MTSHSRHFHFSGIQCEQWLNMAAHHLYLKKSISLLYDIMHCCNISAFPRGITSEFLVLPTAKLARELLHRRNIFAVDFMDLLCRILTTASIISLLHAVIRMSTPHLALSISGRYLRHFYQGRQMKLLCRVRALISFIIAHNGESALPPWCQAGAEVVCRHFSASVISMSHRPWAFAPPLWVMTSCPSRRSHLISSFMIYRNIRSDWAIAISDIDLLAISPAELASARWRRLSLRHDAASPLLIADMKN